MQRKEVQSSLFEPITYVKQLCSNHATAEDINIAQDCISSLRDENNAALKTAVYSHHADFINISKDIAKLETNVTELGNLLNAEHEHISNFLSSLKSGIIPGFQNNDIHDFLLSDIQGLDKSDPLVAGEVLSKGPLQLIHIQQKQLHVPVQIFLLKNSLVIAKKESVTGLLRPSLTLLSVEPLSDLSIENMGDEMGNQQTFTISGRENYMFHAPSGFDKRKWARQLAAAVNALQGRSVNDENHTLTSAHVHGSLAESWLLEAPEDLECAIAQRNFKIAVECYINATNATEHTTSDPAIVTVRRKLEVLHKRLTDALCRELERPGLRIADICDTIRLLLTLCEKHKALEKYLSYWTRTLHRGYRLFLTALFTASMYPIFLISINVTRNLKVEGSTELFVRKLSSKLFNILKTTCMEFQDLFEGPESQSAYVAWVDQEVSQFIGIFRRQVFGTTTNTFETVADCIAYVETQAQKLQNVGLDMSFLFWRNIHKDCLDSINEAGQKWLTDVAHQLVEERWTSVQFNGRNARREFVRNLTLAGVTYPEDLLEGMTTVLFQVTINFAVDSHEFADSAAKIYNEATSDCINTWIENVYLLVMKKISQESDASEKFGSNTTFVLDTCLSHALALLEEARKGRIPKLRQMQRRLSTTWVSEEALV